MPTSQIENVAPIINYAFGLRPKSVLDLGVGCGKYGHLLREYLDIGQGRLDPDEWKVRIDGVEGFGDYTHYLRQRMWGAYTSIATEDFTVGYYTAYDLVLLIDSLEHLDKEAGRSLLSRLIRHNKNVIVSCPFGPNYREQGAVFGNEFERHRAHWTPEEFKEMRGTHIYSGVCTVWHLKGQG